MAEGLNVAQNPVAVWTVVPISKSPYMCAEFSLIGGSGVRMFEGTHDIRGGGPLQKLSE